MKNYTPLFIATIVIAILLAVSIALGSRYNGTEENTNTSHEEQTETIEVEETAH